MWQSFAKHVTESCKMMHNETKLQECVATCKRVFTICRKISQNVTGCCKLLSIAAKCRQVLQSVTTCCKFIKKSRIAHCHELLRLVSMLNCRKNLVTFCDTLILCKSSTKIFLTCRNIHNKFMTFYDVMVS